MSFAVRSLRVGYRTPRGTVHAVRGVDLQVGAGERLALVGESGSGKTTVVAAALGLLPTAATATGTIAIGDDERDAADRRGLGRARGRVVSAVPQGAMAGLHPTTRVVDQVAEMVRLHADLRRGAATARAAELLHDVGLDGRATSAFPHELSGGMRQRVALAAALAGRPSVLVADEPTVGLDAVTAARFLELLGATQAEHGFALVLVSHDMRVVDAVCERIAVMYAGRVVEEARTDELRLDPAHPYTAGLLRAAPSLNGGGWSVVPGVAPDLHEPPDSCSFAPRCPHRHPACASAPTLRSLGTRAVACHLVDDTGPTPETTFPVVERRPGTPDGPVVARLRGVTVRYRSRSRLSTSTTTALEDADLEVRGGEIVGLVGASGAGKSTLTRVLLGLVQPDAGDIEVDGVTLGALPRRELRALRRRVALVHQDPYSSLHPAMPVVELVAEPLAMTGVGRPERRRRAAEALALVGLAPDDHLLDRHASGLSGGQRQRVALARAMVTRPSLVLLDEPMSMLDASVRAGIAGALLDARDELGLGAILVTHDLGEAAGTCDRLVVMANGRLVEDGPTAQVLAAPSAPETKELLALADDPLRRTA